MMNRIKSLSVTIMACLLLGFGATHRAHAQAVVPVSYIHSYGGWDLIEVKDTSGTFLGFWAIPRVPVDVGNIRRLWFESMADGNWTLWAFEPVAIDEWMDSLYALGAAQNSMDMIAYKERLSADTEIDLDIDGGADGKVVKGFIEGDPLTETAGSLDDPDTMIDLLASVGYPIAPGLTDLMVNGTAGASVAMNPLTKEAIDCLRSGDSTCGECVCSRIGGEIIAGEWDVDADWVDFNTRLRCTYTRTEEHIYWRAGLWPDDCQDCTAGSPDDPLTNTVTVEIVQHWMGVDECPDEPL